MYLILGGITLYVMMRQFNKVNCINKKTYSIKYIPNDKLYFYCNNIVKFYHKQELEKCLKKKISKILWENKLKDIHLELYQRIWKNKINNLNIEFNKTINENFCLWIYRNEINILKDNKIIILDFNSIFDYLGNNFTNKTFLFNLSKFCYKNKIIFVIITELHPSFVSKFGIKYLNHHNIITPFHFKVRALGGITRLKENELANKAAEISINKIIIDIFNRYGSNYNDTFYIGTNSVPKMKCKILVS